jgi:DNA-binding NtrC family response regulator
MADKLKILIIDDDSSVCTSLGRMVVNSGYEAILSNSGQEGLKIAEIMKPDLILLDVTMPGMDGMAALRQFHEKYQEIQVIMLATSPDMPKAHEALNCGAGDFITKPVDLFALKRTLQLHLPK